MHRLSFMAGSVFGCSLSSDHVFWVPLLHLIVLTGSAVTQGLELKPKLEIYSWDSLNLAWNSLRCRSAFAKWKGPFCCQSSSSSSSKCVPRGSWSPELSCLFCGRRCWILLCSPRCCFQSTFAFTCNEGLTVTPTEGASSAVVITFTLCMTGTGNCANTSTLLSDVSQAWWSEVEGLCAIRSTCQDGEESELAFICLPQQSHRSSRLPNSKGCAEESYTTTPPSFLADAARKSELPDIFHALANSLKTQG